MKSVVDGLYLESTLGSPSMRSPISRRRKPMTLMQQHGEGLIGRGESQVIYLRVSDMKEVNQQNL